MKPTTIQVPDYITDYMRDGILTALHRSESMITHDGGDVPNTFHPTPLTGLQRFPMRPVVAGELTRTLDSFAAIYVEFQPFEKGENPQVSCHMVGHVFWNETMRKELASIRWRFNVKSQDQTNAYITYL